MAYQISKRERGFSDQIFPVLDYYSTQLNHLLSYDNNIYPEPIFDYSDIAVNAGVRNDMSFGEFFNALNSYNALCNIWSKMILEGLATMETFNMVDIISHFRTSRVNRMVGGSGSSLHQFGLALDFVGPSDFINEFYNYVVDNYIKNGSRMLEDNHKTKLFPREVIIYYSGHISKANRIHIGFKYVSQHITQKELEIPF